ncbi:ATP phosphoribosyltransferase [Aurantimonas sp. MSK8Z-1]|uniref:ATP phosphoribosyltransferase n=1 Tax=Mangrovibrevibacter kandeliae TaxID=2968473 RepID=UPI00211953B8|nr:ATP phosphoribosyltransferase [Aurantimonas sp. MSK8Z-1]MCW4113597.1 ATP phosphoribosyltransferase [Aurantimonas sp. MSK8Z-1]
MSVTLAIPSKGRLKDDTIERLAAAGIRVALDEDARSYRAAAPEIEGLDVLLMSASEIARELAAGSIDFGVTGLDLLHETIEETSGTVEVVAELGFGHADVVVAVPEAWVDVDGMDDLDDVAAGFRQRHHRRMRIATKYRRLTEGFFTRRHGIQTYRIVESLGATEAAPAAGTADIVVDITTTGSTLRANRLKTLDDGLILASQACIALRKSAARDLGDAAIVTQVCRMLRAAAV